MVRTLIDIDSAGKPAAVQLANFHDYTYVYLQVIGPGYVRLATNVQELVQPAPGSGGLLNGLQIASTDGLVLLRWIGELWGIGVTGGVNVDIQIPTA
jgi:hypothetical protein